jgi:hypothetical protein
MVLHALALKLKREARDDFRGRHFVATLIVQAVSWGRVAKTLVVEDYPCDAGALRSHGSIFGPVEPFYPPRQRG